MTTVNGYFVEVTPYYYGKMGEDGPYMAVCHMVTATDPKGNVFTHNWSTSNRVLLHNCEKLVERIGKTASKDWNPDNENWSFFRRVYGSEAYCENAMEERDNENRLDFDAEYGPGSFDEAKNRGTLPESIR